MTGTRRLGSAFFTALVAALLLSLLAPAAVAHADPTPAQDRRSDRHAKVTLEEALGQTGFGRQQWSTYLCTGYVGCRQAGYGNRGYRGHSGRMYWQMYSGHNCTNYAAYRMVRAGLPNARPWSGTGNAYYWGRAKRGITDSTPMVGSVAWWKADAPGAGSNGHVAYVEKVLSKGRIVISEDSWSGDFHWRRIRKRDGSWPSGFIHFKDVRVRATTEPSVQGVPQVGVPIRVDTGDWTPSARLSLQWYADGEPVPGATGTSFTPRPAQARQRLRVRVVAKASGYRPGSARTVQTAPVHRGDLTLERAAAVTGIPKVGEVLTLVPPRWSPAAATTAVQWYAGGEPVHGATHAHFRVRPELVGLPVKVEVTADANGYRTGTTRSPATDPVREGHLSLTRRFVLDGPTRVGRTLAVTRGAVSPADAGIRYIWLRNGHVIDGAAAASYQIAPRDLGRTLTAEVRLHLKGYHTRTITLSSAAPVTTRPHLTLTTRVRRHTAVVVVDASAPGLSTVHGPVTLRVDGRESTHRLSGGRARWRVRHLAPGRYPVRVDYAGNGSVESQHATTEIRIARPRH